MKNRIPSFARRIARPLRDAQKKLLDKYLPALDVTEKFNIPAEFKNVVLEIGFGNGEFLAANAESSPTTLFVGCEPYLNGVASFLKILDDKELKNVRLYTNDIRNLLPNIKPNSLDIIYVICPDPWPKQKQKKRRLLQSEFLKQLSEKSKKIIIATDHLDYAKWILKHIHQSKMFSIKSENIEDYTKLPENWLYSKYQRRGIENSSRIYYFELQKV